MNPLVTDAQFNSICLIVIAVIGGITTLLTAKWAREAKNNSAETAAQVRTNGGMSDPDPNVNDHIKYQTEMLEGLTHRIGNSEKLLANHIAHSQVMDQALAEVYLTVKPHSARLKYIIDDQNSD